MHYSEGSDDALNRRNIVFKRISVIARVVYTQVIDEYDGILLATIEQSGTNNILYVKLTSLLFCLFRILLSVLDVFFHDLTTDN